MSIPAAVTSEDFVDVDSAVSSSVKLNDDEIIEQVLPPSNSDSDLDDDDEVPCTLEPSHADPTQAFAVLASAYSDNTTLAEIQVDLLARKWKCVQQRIDHCFLAQGPQNVNKTTFSG